MWQRKMLLERNETNYNIETGNCVECNKNYFGDNYLKKCKQTVINLEDVVIFIVLLDFME